MYIYIYIYGSLSSDPRVQVPAGPTLRGRKAPQVSYKI